MKDLRENSDCGMTRYSDTLYSQNRPRTIDPYFEERSSRGMIAQLSFASQER
jgi:hypothetical protein